MLKNELKIAMQRTNVTIAVHSERVQFPLLLNGLKTLFSDCIEPFW